VGALTGSLFSLALNSDQIVSVGASGAIMGLFAAMLVLSMHFPPGPIRTALQMNAIYVLLPSLLPLAGALKGQQVDYAAHFGGATVGFVLLRIWSKDEARPGLRQVAAAIAVAGVVALAYPAVFVLQGYQAVAFAAAQLIPSSKLPRSNTEMKVRAAQLIAEY